MVTNTKASHSALCIGSFIALIPSHNATDNTWIKTMHLSHTTSLLETITLTVIREEPGLISNFGLLDEGPLLKNVLRRCEADIDLNLSSVLR